MSAGGAATIAVEVVVGVAPRDVRCAELRLPAGACVADAIDASGTLDGLDATARGVLRPSLNARRCALDAPLRDGDRVELTRALRADAKQSRRLRLARDAALRGGAASEAMPHRR